MFFLLFRLLPWLASASACFVALVQWRSPELFPWGWICVLIGYVFAVWLMTKKRLTLIEFFTHILPPLLTIFCFGSLWLLAETVMERMGVLVVFSGLIWISLELFYLMHHEPSRYPVNGVSRFHIACIPLTSFALGVLGLGLSVFVGVNVWWLMALFSVILGTMYATTAHPVATREQRISWAIAGSVAGAFGAFLVALLPTSASVSGAMCALLFSLPVRARRYSYQPFPSRKTMVIELVLALFLLALFLVGARWT